MHKRPPATTVGGKTNKKNRPTFQKQQGQTTRNHRYETSDDESTSANSSNSEIEDARNTGEEFSGWTKQDFIEKIKSLQANPPTTIPTQVSMVSTDVFSTLTRDTGEKALVLKKFDEVKDVLEKNLKKYTVQTVFRKKKFNTCETVFKKLCMAAVKDCKVMLPEGCNESQFAYVFWPRMREFLNKARQNAGNSARVKFIGKLSEGWNISNTESNHISYISYTT
jgi:hypothetical protein